MEEGERRAYKCLRAKEEGLTTAFQSLSSASSASDPDLNEARSELRFIESNCLTVEIRPRHLIPKVRRNVNRRQNGHHPYCAELHTNQVMTSRGVTGGRTLVGGRDGGRGRRLSGTGRPRRPALPTYQVVVLRARDDVVELHIL